MTALLALLLAIPAQALTPLPANNKQAIDANFLDMAKEVKRIDLTDGGTVFQTLTVSSNANFGAGIYSSSNVVIMGGLQVYGDTILASSVSVVVTDLSLLGTGAAANPLKVNSSSVAVLVGGYIRHEEIEDGSLETAKLANGAVDTTKLNNDAVTTLKLRDSAVETSKLANDSVIGLKILDATIGTGKLNADLQAQIAASVGAITALTSDVTATGPGSVAATISANAVDTAKIKDDSITVGKILDGAVQTNKLGAQSVTSAKLDDELEVASMSVTGSRFAVSGASFTVREGKVGIGRAAFPITALQITSDGTPYAGTNSLYMYTGQNAAGTKGTTFGYCDSGNCNTDGVIGAAAGSSGLTFVTHGGSWQESVRISDAGDVGISTQVPSASLHIKSRSNTLVGQKIELAASASGDALQINDANTVPLYGVTAWGCVYTSTFTNHSGGALAQGTIVERSGYDYSISTTAVNSDRPIGVVQDTSCANGTRCKVGQGGICYVQLESTEACAFDEFVYSGGEVGKAGCSPLSTLTRHNGEIGHPIQAGGAGTKILVLIHFN